MSKAIGLILTITGLMLGWYFVQNIMLPGPAPLPSFVIAAIALAMISVGVRYILKSPKKKPLAGSPQ
jgi:divalent metal cation (Fe/Co/Zn/Cd) transporter